MRIMAFSGASAELWLAISPSAADCAFIMALLACLVPVVIFLNGTPLVLFSIAYFFSISYSTISLYSYGISEDVTRVEEAEGRQERKGRNEKPAAAVEAYAEYVSLAAENVASAVENVASAVEKWKATGAYREHSLTLGVVAHQMGLPQKQLQEWLRLSEYKKLAGMVATFRIEEAQRVLKEHPDWSVKSVADYCGFNDRKYFHSTFRNVTGMTPANYQRQNF